MEICNKENIKEIVTALKKGETVVFPTDTSYGLGCDAGNQKAVDTIFKIKNRLADKSLLVVVPSVVEAKKYLKWSDELSKLAQDFWPGALTVVGEYIGSALAQGVFSKERTLAVRVTANPWLQKLTAEFGAPLVATSANLSGMPDVYDSQAIIDQYAKQGFAPDRVVDAGILPKNEPTTVVSVVQGEIKILRQGAVQI